MSTTYVTLFNPSTGGTWRTTLDSFNEIWAARGWVLKSVSSHKASFVGPYSPMRYAQEDNTSIKIGYYSGLSFINHSSGNWIDLDQAGGPLARPMDRVFRAEAGQVLEVGIDFLVQMNTAATDFIFFNWGVVGDDGTIIRNVNPNLYGPASWRVDPQNQTGTVTGPAKQIVVGGAISHLVSADEVFNGVVRLRPLVKTFPASGGDGFDKFVMSGPEALGSGTSSVWGNGPFRRRPGTLLVFSGQSLQNTPGGTGGQNTTIGRALVSKLWALGYEVVEHNNSFSGTDFDNRLIGFDTEMQSVRTWYDKFIFIGTGSYSDITDQSGEETAAQIYAEAGAVATAARQAGAMACIQITQTKSATITGGGGADETKRQDYNNLLIEDSAGYFDAVVDPDGLAAFDDYDHTTNPDYYLDVIGHYNFQAVEDIADLLWAAMQADPITFNLSWQS